MVRKPSTFKQRDLARAIAAAKKAGLPIESIKVDPRTGEIELVTGDCKAEDKTEDTWADALKARGRK